VGRRHLAVLDQLAREVLGVVAGDREPDPRRRPTKLLVHCCERRDPDDVTVDVDERAAAVAGIDRGAGLDGPRQGHPARLRDVPAERADDALRHARLEAEGIADRHHDLTDLQLR
jgi:hypothetical protein